MTPHNQAEPGDFAPTVLLPGDPKRAEFIAKNFLTDPVLVNDVRGVHGYTGTIEGVRVSVMASGMGIPSVSIYAHELFDHYGVDQIIRIGSAGALRKDMALGSVVAAMGACTDSNVLSQFDLGASFSPVCDFSLLRMAVEEAEALGITMPVGNVYSSDAFYDEAGRSLRLAKMGVLAVEMEAAGLYIQAARMNKKALALLSISDNLITGEVMPARERETTFTDMITIALRIAGRCS